MVCAASINPSPEDAGDPDSKYGRIDRDVRNLTPSPRDPVAAFLALRPLLILDGALATELERRGADLRDPLWSAKLIIDRPDAIEAVHLDYFRAGADVATTATYQATFEGFARRGIDAAGAAQLMRAAVALACAARDEFWADASNRIDRLRPLVAASVGPYGAMLADGSEYRGHYPVSDTALRDFHRPRIHVLAESGADLLACETIPSLREAQALAAVLEEFPAMTAWMSFSCRDGVRTCEGQEIGDCVAQFKDHVQIVGVGVNCTAPEHISSLLQRMRNRTNKPLLVYPNSGERYDAGAKQWRGQPCATPFAEQALRWYREGARLIGGCCRTTPEDIRAIRAWALNKTPASP
jgi:homocysteine S-methyltransferase